MKLSEIYGLFIYWFNYLRHEIYIILIISLPCKTHSATESSISLQRNVTSPPSSCFGMVHAEPGVFGQSFRLALPDPK